MPPTGLSSSRDAWQPQRLPPDMHEINSVFACMQWMQMRKQTWQLRAHPERILSASIWIWNHYVTLADLMHGAWRDRNHVLMLRYAELAICHDDVYDILFD